MRKSLFIIYPNQIVIISVMGIRSVRYTGIELLVLDATSMTVKPIGRSLPLSFLIKNS